MLRNRNVESYDYLQALPLAAGCGVGKPARTVMYPSSRPLSPEGRGETLDAERLCRWRGLSYNGFFACEILADCAGIERTSYFD